MLPAEVKSISEIRPSLPEGWAELSEEDQQQAVDQARNLLKIRRNLIELTAGQRTARGLIQQAEANAEQVYEHIVEGQKEGKGHLPAHRIKHLEGRLQVYHAEVEKQSEYIDQYSIEIDLYRVILSNMEPK